MFDHIGIDVRDLHRSKQFYQEALAPLGIQLLVYWEEWKAAGFGTDRPRFWLGGGEPGNGPRNGEDEVHICFSARNRAEVRAFHEAALRAGGRDLGPPGMRPQYHASYYGAFVLDPDGHNVEACCHAPE
jgi:catechol 2,3-dioxygenase-like lactoylglutathione lyase family enzyme